MSHSPRTLADKENMTQHKRKTRVLDRLSDYSNESLLVEIRRIAEVVGSSDLTLDDIEKHGRCSYTILKQRFGGLRGALKAAGLEAKDFNRNVTEEQLLHELARIWDLVLTHEGRRPYKNDLAKYHARFSYGPYYRQWGSWIRACEVLLDWEGVADDVSVETAEKKNEQIPDIPKRKRTIPLRIRYAILLRDRFTCQLCGKSPSTTPGFVVDVDHITAESKGGTLDPSNLRCLCRECNVGKGPLDEL